MAVIRFSHVYPKLHGQKRATLVAVRPIRIDENTPKELLEYDTAYDGGHFTLPYGDYKQLVFIGDKGIPFCTIREHYPAEKGDYYDGSLGDEFEIKIKREKEVEEREKRINQTNGNAAALREALVKIYHEIRSYCHDYGAGESHESLVERILDDPPDYTSYKESILEIDRVVETALAASPRNCDRPECATLEKATNTWIQEEFSMCDSKATMADIRTFDVWIYAPATEQKGENNEKK